MVELYGDAEPGFDLGASPPDLALCSFGSVLLMRAILGCGVGITSGSPPSLHLRLNTSLLCLHLNGDCSFKFQSLHFKIMIHLIQMRFQHSLLVVQV